MIKVVWKNMLHYTIVCETRETCLNQQKVLMTNDLFNIHFLLRNKCIRIASIYYFYNYCIYN